MDCCEFEASLDYIAKPFPKKGGKKKKGKGLEVWVSVRAPLYPISSTENKILEY